MPRLAAVLPLILAACSLSDANQPAGAAAGEMEGWRFASGRTPSRGEYIAVVAACQAGAVQNTAGRPLEACLADLGLRRAE